VVQAFAHAVPVAERTVWYWIGGQKIHPAMQARIRSLDLAKKKQRNPRHAQRIVAAATDLAVKQGGVIHEDAMWDAAEMALDGASKETIAERIKQARAEAYKPRGGWRAR
jgi:hypothetical protein